MGQQQHEQQDEQQQGQQGQQGQQQQMVSAQLVSNLVFCMTTAGGLLDLRRLLQAFVAYGLVEPAAAAAAATSAAGDDAAPKILPFPHLNDRSMHAMYAAYTAVYKPAFENAVAAAGQPPWRASFGERATSEKQQYQKLKGFLTCLDGITKDGQPAAAEALDIAERVRAAHSMKPSTMMREVFASLMRPAPVCSQPILSAVADLRTHLEAAGLLVPAPRIMAVAGKKSKSNLQQGVHSSKRLARHSDISNGSNGSNGSTV
jgi:hypothetical protein